MEHFIKKAGEHKEVIISSVVLSALAALIVVAAGFGLLHSRWGASIAELAGNGTSTAAVGTALPPTGGEADIISTVSKANPSVVSIIISKDVPIIERRSRNFGPFSFMFPDDSQQAPQSPQSGSSQQIEIGGGSGFIVSSDGLVITNKHVVEDTSASYKLFTNDGTQYDVKVVATDPFYDIAVLKIQSDKKFPYLQFGDSDTIQLGETAIAIGNALAEFRNSVSVGVVSGLSRSVTAGSEMGGEETLDQAIQTDAAINPGNSGGPLLNSRGNVIGVNVALVEGSENIGFALPGNIAKTAVESVEKTGTIVRPYLGVRTLSITPQIAKDQNLSVDHGELVTEGDTPNEPAVFPNSPAAKAGIKAGDIILKVDGQDVDADHSLGSLVRDHNVGDIVTIIINRNGAQSTFQIKLEAAPQDIGA